MKVKEFFFISAGENPVIFTDEKSEYICEANSKSKIIDALGEKTIVSWYIRERNLYLKLKMGE